MCGSTRVCGGGYIYENEGYIFELLTKELVALKILYYEMILRGSVFSIVSRVCYFKTIHSVDDISSFK